MECNGESYEMECDREHSQMTSNWECNNNEIDHNLECNGEHDQQFE